MTILFVIFAFIAGIFIGDKIRSAIIGNYVRENMSESSTMNSLLKDYVQSINKERNR